MSGHIPGRVDPGASADKGKRFVGLLRQDQMDRLREMVVGRDHPIEVELQFERQDRWVVVRGRVVTTLVVTCQACLENVELHADVAVGLAVIRSIEDAEMIPDDLEPVLCNGDTLDLASLVEDELILTVPIVPRHTLCEGESPSDLSKEEFSSANRSQRESPFAVLANLQLGEVKRD